MKKSDLVVLGNGFDLNCGLRTRYYSYFMYKLENNESMKKFYHQLMELDTSNYGRWHGLPQDDIENMEKINDTFTVWDVMFLLLGSSSKNNYSDSNWCDIEKLINVSLTVDASSFPFVWRGVCNIINNCKTSHNNKLNFAVTGLSLLTEIMGYWLPTCEEFQKYNPEDEFLEYEFLDFLYEQLRMFENDFSAYIQKLIYEDNDYNFKANQLINEITGESKSYIIDSFNYTKFNENINNIHGCADGIQPIIFGIDDMGISEDHSLYKFTKTSRKVELLFHKNNGSWNNYIFDNIYIYGHSLSLADYSYFFDLFDKIKLSEPEKIQTKIHFCYTIYCKDSVKDIMDTLRVSTENLIKRYAEYIGCKENLMKKIMQKNIISFKEIK